jgi:hypothetical protein
MSAVSAVIGRNTAGKSAVVTIHAVNQAYLHELETLMFACRCRNRAALVDLALATLSELKGRPPLPPRMRTGDGNGTGHGAEDHGSTPAE